MNFIDLFSVSVQKNMDKSAVIDRGGDRATSYSELDLLSGRIAGKLKCMNIPKNSFVMIHMDRCTEYIAAYIGILKAGCAVVLTSMEYPRERVEYIRVNSDAAAVISDSFFDDIDKYDTLSEPENDSKPAVLLYTSGSTGNPKGILYSAGDLARAAVRHTALFEGVEPVVFGASAQISFGVHLFEYLTTFHLGGTVHILSEQVRKSAKELALYYDKHGVTIGWIAPQMLRFFKPVGSGFICALAGGERMSNISPDGFGIRNVYGMTETAAIATMFNVDRAYENTPIGKALAPYEVFVCDENGNALSGEGEGEICIRGESDTVYFKDEENTRRIMIKDSDGLTTFHTGDIGRINENGDLVFVNRRDWMVKINGQRVETLEIETLLGKMPEMENAVVKAFDDADGQTYLTAYYVPRDFITEDEIRARLASRLTAYMIPRFFVRLDEMPKNSNGKLDRKALLPPASENYKVSYAPPTDKTEEALCRAFEDVLHCGRVGIDDDFFTLGGDSIKVMKLIEAVGLNGLSADMVLSGKKPKIISELLRQKASSFIVHNEEIPEICPMTESQRGVFLECIKNPETTKYNIPILCVLPDGTDTDRFISAVRQVAQIHKALFVTLGTPDGVPSMIYRGEKEILIYEKPVDSIDDECRSFIRPFDLENGPLYRFEIIRSPEKTAFLMDIHHTVFDGTSLNEFLRQIVSVYDGEAVPEEALTVFDVSLAEALPKDVLQTEKSNEFFGKYLDGVDNCTAPLSDRITEEPDPCIKLFLGDASDRIGINDVKEFVKATGITENTLFAGSFGYALAKLNGTSDSFFTTAYSGRNDRRLISTVGMFVRTLPVHCRFDENTSPAEFLKTVHDDMLVLKKNRTHPFDSLATQYGLNLDVSFTFQSDLLNDVPMSDGMIEVKLLETEEFVGNINVMLMKGHEGYNYSVHYSTALYSEEFIRSFMDLFVRSVCGMISEKALKDIVLADRDSISRLDLLNSTEVEYPAHKTVIDLFREQSRRTPDNTCLVYNGKRYTYSEVDSVTDALAARLKKSGIGKEKIVGVLIPRCEYMLLCSLGILKAGGAYLPLDPTYPPERLNLMMKDSGAVMLITTPGLNEIITDDFTGERMMTDEILSLPPCDIPLPSPSPDDLFIILYTSGSTGVPKGVMYEHSNALVTTEWVKKYFAIGESSHVTAYASYGFDANVFDMYPAVTSGAELHIISDEIRLDFPALRDYFNDNAITHTVMTTQVGRQFAQFGGLRTLRHLSVAGEKLTPPDVPEGFALYNLYGPSECSVVTSAFRVDRRYRDVPIGSPVDNLKIYITDKNGRLLPENAVGELWISGPHITRGYLNRPEKTAESFGENPFSSESGYERIYRTGDTVRILSGGNLQFVGRRDSQVKIRGFRIELTEIEEVIRRFDGITNATVAAFEDQDGGKFIAAYVVSDKMIDIDSLNAFIRAEKPSYMVPAVTMQIDTIPLNQNQKVNKKALPKPERKSADIVLPENEIQQKIYDTIAEIIGHRSFGIDSDIFESGLTSIGTLKLNVRLGSEFDTPVKFDDIQKNNTVKKLEILLSSGVKTRKYELLTDYPITQTQKGIFVECASAKSSVTYNIPMLIKLGGNVDLSRLVSAIKTAVNAHPYIKTTLFADESGEIRALRQDDADVTVNEIVTKSLPPKEELVRPYLLLKSPLYRITVYKTDSGNYLFMDFHHIIFDGTSGNILLADIDRAYAGLTPEKEKYTGYEAALDEENTRNSSRYDEAKAYYDSVFKGCETSCLPPVSPEAEETGAASLRHICKTDAERVMKYCEKNSLTPNAFFNTAFGYTISKFGQFDDSVFTTVYNGRSDSRLSSSVTMLVKTLPVLIRTDGDRVITEMIRATQEQLMNSMANDIYSFAEIAGAYGIRSDMIFVYQGDSFTFDSMCGEDAGFMTVQSDVSKAPISVNVYLRNGRFEIETDYRRDMYCKAFINSLIDVFCLIIDGFIKNEKTSDIRILSDEAECRLSEINDTHTEFENIPANRFIERISASDPDRIAVICDGRQVTYGELNRLANRMAHSLIENGVKKDTIVGLMLHRTVELSVTELAILKSGCAFLGLLPEYPDDRVDFCLTDADSPIIITTREIKESRPSLFGDDKPYRTLTLDELLENGNEDNTDLIIPPDSLAYCIYTSGSTGKPKGVMIEHHSLANCAQPADFTYSFYNGKNSGNVALALSSISFDMSVFDNLLMLMAGKTVCIATEREIHNPAALAELMLNNKVDTMATTPSFLTNTLTIPQFIPALKNIKTLVAGAEVFPKVLYNELRKLSPDMHIINGYGPSECTITCSSKKLCGGDGITIGGPSQNTSFYIIDRFGNILPPFACGELIICGESVGRGYIKLPEKTKQAFFTLRSLPAYHSGDIVRLNGDGEIEFFGRRDNQVKLRGFRVELDEIEKCICTFEGITQSKVIVRNNGSEDFLAGFFTADRTVDISELSDHLKSKLTYYMVPDAMMQLKEMPLTTSGKIDKKALPDIKREVKKTGRRAPKKSLEEELCDLFRSVLALDEYYADDNFFEMGGTSLSASKVTMQLMSKGYKAEYQDIFSNPTPELLAEYLGSLSSPHSKAEDGKVTADDSATNELLRYNTLEYAHEVRREPLGDVLLTGAVGFLGIHVLKELIESKEGRIICLVRRGDAPSSVIRLKNMLMYYFGQTFDDEFTDCISVIDADITDDDLKSVLDPLHFDTLINCAACVKHYASGDIIERINVHGVENLIASVKDKNARMIQISTTSVPGVHTDETWKRQLRMHENELFVIDDMDNKYCISKYHAELKMLDAIEAGMRGKIIRVGNLMGRHSDGEFQINFNTNAFLNALRGFATVGKCPISHATDPMSFSPIDMTAKAIVLLAGTNDKFTAFHADNRFGIDEMQLIDAANKCGVSITPVPDDEYYSDYYRMLGDEKVNARLQGLVTNDRPDLHMVDTDNVFTANILYRLGFSWPLMSPEYLERLINALLTLDYFEADYGTEF